MQDNIHSNCTPQELAEKRQQDDGGFLLLDVRSDQELELAALHPCKHIPLHELQERVGELAAWRDKEVICLCHHGIRSATARNFLAAEGFTHARNLAGGIDAYALDVDPDLPRYL